jgi:hypothetical protein
MPHWYGIRDGRSLVTVNYKLEILRSRSLGLYDKHIVQLKPF